MANIVTPFAADEAFSTSARAKCIAIAEYWLGTGATSSVSTWGDFHTLINPTLTTLGITNISNGDTGQQWLDRMNLANTVEQETVDLVDRFTGTPPSGRKAQIEKLIVALKTAGVWAKLDALYLLAAHDAQAARRNWVADQYNLTAISSPTFTADRGYAGDGSAAYLDTNFNPTTAVSPKFTQNSAHLSVWDRSTRAANNTSNEIGIRDGTTSSSHIHVNFTALGAVARLNHGTTGNLQGAVTNGSGHTLATRSASNAEDLYKNGASINTQGTASAAPANTSVLVLARNLVGTGAENFSADQIAAASIGSNLSAGEITAFYNALNTYLQAVGAA